MQEELRDNIRVILNTYSEIGDLIGTEDANGNKTAMQYNQRHEMVLLSHPETAISRFEYDAIIKMDIHPKEEPVAE